MLQSPRACAAAALIGLAFLAAPAAANAAPSYPPGGNSITVTTTSPTVGATVTVSAKTFLAGSDVDVTTTLAGAAGSNSTALGESFGGGRAATAVVAAAAGTCETGSTCTVVADSVGLASAAVKLTEAGSTTVTFEGVDANRKPLTHSVELTVAEAGAAAADPSGSGLASTGPRDLVQVGAIALGMLAIGTLLVFAVRHRRDQVATA